MSALPSLEGWGCVYSHPQRQSDVPIICYSCRVSGFGGSRDPVVGFSCGQRLGGASELGRRQGRLICSSRTRIPQFVELVPPGLKGQLSRTKDGTGEVAS